ncbi:MAG: TRAP transporter large permease [Chloroflexi bacterium]|nr:TRAP transporter large permease [Chloroflexota bacterium]
MDNILIGVIGVVVLVILFLLRMPVAFAMAFVGLIGFSIVVTPAAGMNLLARDFFDIFSSYSLTVIPMFTLMGCIASESGMSRRLYDAGYVLFSRFPGGLALATVMGCAGFAAINGSTSATAAAMGKVCIPEMKRYKYDDSLATGIVAAAGTLGIMIPPSTIFIVYGILTEQSIGKLFMAGVFPGLLIAALLMAAVAIICKFNPRLAPAGEPSTFKEKMEALTGIIEMLFLFCFVILGLFFGWFSPTQAGAAGVAGAIIIGLITRQLTWAGFVNALKDTVRITCMVMLIVAGATVFGHFIAITTIPMMLTEWVGALPLPPVAIMGIIIIIYIIGGCFMDSLALITLTIPIFYPVVLALGFDPIWFGVIIVLVTEIGVITPPVGLNVYVIKGIAPDIPLETIFKGITPFLAALIVAAVILLAFPQIATFLPSLAKY